MRILTCLAVLFAIGPLQAVANTEKVIFVAPNLVKLPDARPGLDFLQLPLLTHDRPSLETSVAVAFPSTERPHGLDHWYLLRDLDPKQRYELRVCWTATQPTNFWPTVHTLSEVFDTPSLIQNLAATVEKPEQRSAHTGPSTGAPPPGNTQESVLFLHLEAAADFFSTNRTLMLYPPPVDVNLILDPYWANVFPQSLIPTAGYLIVLAVGSWVLSYYIWKYLQPVARAKQHVE